MMQMKRSRFSKGMQYCHTAPSRDAGPTARSFPLEESHSFTTTSSHSWRETGNPSASPHPLSTSSSVLQFRGTVGYVYASESWYILRADIISALTEFQPVFYDGFFFLPWNKGLAQCSSLCQIDWGLQVVPQPMLTRATAASKTLLSY